MVVYHAVAMNQSSQICPIACTIACMSIEELETEAMKLDPKGRARLAERLLASLENLSDEESAVLWAEEAERRDANLDANPNMARPADDVLRNAYSNLR